MEFLLPVFLKLFPNMLPSTFQDKMKEQVIIVMSDPRDTLFKLYTIPNFIVLEDSEWTNLCILFPFGLSL